MRVTGMSGLALVTVLSGTLMSACAGLGDRSGPGPIKLEALLTVEEYRAAGLDSLDEEEVAALERALTRALSGDGPRADDADMVAAWEASEEDDFATFGLPDEHPFARRHDAMSARLGAAVSNWSRGREITLGNGQVWVLTESAHFGFSAADAGTPVVIRRASMGSFRIQVADRNFTPRVRRVK